jgi:hypothetical protein
MRRRFPFPISARAQDELGAAKVVFGRLGAARHLVGDLHPLLELI